jgi:hypothetical protein
MAEEVVWGVSASNRSREEIGLLVAVSLDGSLRLRKFVPARHVTLFSSVILARPFSDSRPRAFSRCG